MGIIELIGWKIAARAKKGNEELLECCQAVLDFIDLSSKENMAKMDRELEKNGFMTSYKGTNMIDFFDWLRARYDLEQIKINGRINADFFSAEENGSSPARAMLAQAIRDIKIESLLSEKNNENIEDGFV
jgi:hypothetical protein